MSKYCLGRRKLPSMKRISTALIIILSTAALLGAGDIEKKLAREPFHLVRYFNQARSSYVNWSALVYFASFKQQIKVEKSDNFVQKALFEKRELIKRAQSQMLQDILRIDIDSEMTIKELLEISKVFNSSLTRLFYSPEILLPPVQAGYGLTLDGFTPFDGAGGFIDLILKSGYFVEWEKLSRQPSRYKPVAYERLIIEARHLSVNPALFPKIYSFDKDGNKILVYSLMNADREAISQKGYAHYYSDTQFFDLGHAKNFYCPAMELSGTKGNDLVISREDYIKFFGSDVSLQNLSRGQLYIVTGDGAKPTEN